MSEALIFKGELVGHRDWVTSITTSDKNPGMVVTGSRDKSLIKWGLTGEQENFGIAEKRFTSHSHTVSDVALSVDSEYALSASWDKTLRLWHLASGTSTNTFVGHEKDALSVAISSDNSKIVSGARDGTVRVWNVLGECKAILGKAEGGHEDWVTCVRFSPTATSNVVVTAGYDKVVKVWDLKTGTLRSDLIGHTGYLNAVTISPDGSLCASGGKDGTAMLWDLSEGKRLYSLEAGSTINALVFSPNRYWLCAATMEGVRVWDLEAKKVVATLEPEWEERGKKALTPHCTCLAWSGDGNTLFAGYSDGIVRVWGV